MPQNPVPVSEGQLLQQCIGFTRALRLAGIAIDPAGASAFRLVDPVAGVWDAERCRLAGIRVDRLAPIHPAAAVVGRLTPEAAGLTGLLDPAP